MSCIESQFTVVSQAYERLQSQIQQISTMGCSESTNFDSSEDTQVENYEHGEKKEKELEEYPRPLAVVGTSLL